MDIKLRSNDNDEAYEAASPVKGKKYDGLWIFICTLIAAALVFISAANLVDQQDTARMYSLHEESYEDKVLGAGNVREQIIRYCKNLNRYYIYFGGDMFETLTPSGKVSVAEIYEKKEDMLSQGADSIFLQKYEEYFNDELFMRITLDEKDQNYSDVKRYLTDEKQFSYYIVDESKNVFYTNIKELKDGEMSFSEIMNDSGKFYMRLKLTDMPFMYEDFGGVNLTQSFEDNHLSGYIFINRADGEEMTRQIEDRLSESEPRTYIREYTMVLGVCIVLLVITLALALKNFSKVIKANILLYKLYSYLPLVVKLGGGIIAAVFLIFEIAAYPYDFFNNIRWGNSAFRVVSYVLIVASLLLCLLLTLEYCITTLRNIRSLKNEPEIKLAKMFTKDMGYLIKCRYPWVIALYLGVLAAALFFIVIFANYVEISLLVTPPVFVLCHLFLVNYAKLVYSIKEMADGRMDARVNPYGLFSKPVVELGHVQDGVKLAVEDMIRSEKLKAELVTNVSHDLKTPLTSIINYVALLKDTPNQSATAAEYIDVIDKKSERLKVLIEDLFEATKLNSGSVELTKEHVDVVNLINQTMGELSERINAAGLIFKFSHIPEHIFLDLDGKKMYRVFENILGNIIKYSAPNSRAYISAEEKATGVEIVFKNMSMYELNVTPDELFHRFKRGDAARSTEGSGLGLSIARSIVELHGGGMGIEVDGDLFKLTIRL